MKQRHWPARWDCRKGAIYYRPRPAERERFNGQYYYRLGKTESEAFAAWARIQSNSMVPRTIREAIGMYRASDRFAKLADSTRKDYNRALEKIDLVFGELAPKDVLPSDVYRFLDAFPDVTANRYRAVFSNLMMLCVRKGAVTRNIIRDVEQLAEEPRERYVTDAELDHFSEKYCDAELQARIAILRATGARPGQIRILTRFAWDGEGLTVDSAKRGRKVRYTGPILKATIERMLSERKGKRAKSEYLFPNRSGRMYTPDGWRTGWQRAMAEYEAAGHERFQERDIRAKVASDSESLIEANERLGHQSTSTTKRVYRRGIVNVKELRR
jgi:integrase